MALKSGELWYYRTPQAVSADIAVAQAIILGLISFVHLNTSAIQYVQLFDNSTIPANGARPLVEIPLNPGGMASYTPWNKGRKFNKGLVIALSSTSTILTRVTALELTFQAEGVAP
jgi:hypothetical protein